MKNKFVTYGDGYADVTLSRPLDVNGAKLSTIRLREPTVRDQLAASKVSSDDAEQEIALAANLSDIAPDDIKGLTSRDYTRVRQALLGFLD
ncbi:hypothetical protein LMG31506_02991 [Cupriavidus yeoncheonensis]|uniref:Phage tail assembly protein n=1 Tax=Cupriavidus yeoncheonensis TaxID=1462994 RepID=A0A916IUN1_9BURK|nr:phage tail assembly protein [Cupriavidus yeoncheonensis]CAG2144369.1 hypothetical protein LMG31506_02991 [Cupriavidus yeoncheonensis]